MIEDEFTIARPRWVVPVAIIGALLLFLGVVVGTLISSGDHAPTVRYTGATTTVVTTTTVP
jgi:hypothetical protein